MLGKLFKYENRAVSKILFPLSIAVILLSVFGAAMLKLNFVFEGFYEQENIVSNLISTGSNLLMIFSILAIVSANFVAVFLIMQRYYRNLFTDEGYLTFTLPVTPVQIILSKLFTAIIWSVIIVLCTIAGVFIFVVFGTSSSFINYEVIDAIKEVWHQIASVELISLLDWFLFIFEFILMGIVSMVTSFLLIYLSITLGSQIAKKHKILASVGMYFVISSVVSTVESIIMAMIMILNFGSLEAEPTSLFEMYLLFIGAIVVNLIVSVVYFFVNKYVLTNKLNIE